MKILNMLRELNSEFQHCYAEISSLNKQLAERDAVIKNLETQIANCATTCDSYTKSWKELRDATGCETHFDALDWIRRHRAADQQPAPESEGELVPWDATTRPRGVVIVRLISRDPDCEYQVCKWTSEGFEDVDQDFTSWESALHWWEWSRDGVTWQPCGTRKAVEK